MPVYVQNVIANVPFLSSGKQNPSIDFMAIFTDISRIVSMHSPIRCKPVSDAIVNIASEKIFNYPYLPVLPPPPPTAAPSPSPWPSVPRERSTTPTAAASRLTSNGKWRTRPQLPERTRHMQPWKMTEKKRKGK